jgi:inhibitor of KinA
LFKSLFQIILRLLFRIMNTALPYRIYPSGDNALTIELGSTIDLAINQKILTLFQYLKNQNIPGIKDFIPAYNSLTVVYDVMVIREKHFLACQFIQEQIEMAMLKCENTKAIIPRRIDIPVCYDPSLGIDLEEMAEQKKMTIKEIIRLHTHPIYHVYMIGFLPGFAYLGTVPEKIVTPRRTKPRTKIAAGSVGIAGAQTGIYSLDSPGGWNVIGQTPLQLIDIEKECPVYLQAGDEIKFISIDLKEFNKLKNKG